MNFAAADPSLFPSHHHPAKQKREIIKQKNANKKEKKNYRTEKCQQKKKRKVIKLKNLNNKKEKRNYKIISANARPYCQKEKHNSKKNAHNIQ